MKREVLGDHGDAVAPDDTASTSEQRESLELVDELLDELPLEQRAVFACFELDGMSGEQIAELLDIPLGTVWSRLRLARERFRETEPHERSRRLSDTAPGSHRMKLPKRWIEDKSESTALERAILRPALQVTIPSGVEQRIWARLAVAAPLAAVALTASSAAASSAATVAAEGGAGAATAIGTGVKIGLGVVGKAFAIGAVSGALFAGGLSAVAPAPSTQEAAPAPAVQTRPAERTPPQRSNETSLSSPGPLGEDEPAVTVPAAPARSAALSDRLREAAPRDGTQPAAPSVSAFPSLSSPPAPPPSSRLREEAAVLRRAREGLRQGNLSAAFAELEVARTAFPRGALGEEREALTIELLARSGQRDAARLRAQAFLRSFPKSAYAANVRQFVF